MSGSMPESQVEALLRAIGRNKTVVEIGCYRGRTTKRIAQADNVVFAIDPLVGGIGDGSGTDRELSHNNDVVEELLKNIEGLQVKWIRKTSAEALAEWDKPINVVLIDGEHSYKAVKHDLQWARRLSRGGLLAAHDYGNKRYPGVRRAIDEFMAKHPKYKRVGKHSGLVLYREAA